MTVAPDVLHRLRELADELRNLDLTLVNDEERIREHKAQREAIVKKQLVDIMNTIGVSAFSIEPDGNLPGLDFEMGNHYAGNIAASWSEERREAAFAVVPPDLIQYTVTIHFTRHQHDRAKAIAQKLISQGETVSIDKRVNAGTLKAWIRETYENAGELPDLELIGGGVWPEVKVKQRRVK